LGIAAVCVSVVGYILAYVAVFSCQFLSFEGYDYYYFSYYEINLGLFSAWDPIAMECRVYDDTAIFGGGQKFARAMAIIATILGFLAFVATLCLSCMSMPNLILKIVSILYLISGLCVILTLSIMADCDGTCQIGSAGALAIVAPFFYLAAAIIVFKIPLYESDGGATNEVKPEDSKQAPEKNVTIEVTHLPDGRKQTVKTTIDENGNKTVENTIEESPDEEDPEEESTVVVVLPNGFIKTTRTSFDEDGFTIVTETIEAPG
jgi:hypothetical protein